MNLSYPTVYKYSYYSDQLTGIDVGIDDKTEYIYVYILIIINNSNVQFEI
jgi:hypothetical protein